MPVPFKNFYAGKYSALLLQGLTKVFVFQVSKIDLAVC